jgi:hypothetical protein
MRKDGHTPKSYAMSSAITELHGLYKLYYVDPARIEGTTMFQRAVMLQLAKLHNRMLDDSDLDGLHITPNGWVTGD